METCFAKDRPNVVKYDALVNKLLQEAQSRQNKARQRIVGQAFMATQQRRSGKNANSNVSSSTSSSTTASPSTGNNNKSKKLGEKGKKNIRCNY